MQRIGVITCVKMLGKAQGRKLYFAANGASNPQNTNPVMVMDTVQTYLIIHTLFGKLFFGRRNKKNSVINASMPTQIFDCAVKYKSRLDQWEKPSFFAENNEKNTPPSAEMAISIFNKREIVFRLVILFSMPLKKIAYSSIFNTSSNRERIGKVG